MLLLKLVILPILLFQFILELSDFSHLSSMRCVQLGISPLRILQFPHCKWILWSWREVQVSFNSAFCTVILILPFHTEWVLDLFVPRVSLSSEMRGCSLWLVILRFEHMNFSIYLVHFILSRIPFFIHITVLLVLLY